MRSATLIAVLALSFVGACYGKYMVACTWYSALPQQCDVALEYMNEVAVEDTGSGPGLFQSEQQYWRSAQAAYACYRNTSAASFANCPAVPTPTGNTTFVTRIMRQRETCKAGKSPEECVKTAPNSASSPGRVLATTVAAIVALALYIMA